MPSALCTHCSFLLFRPLLPLLRVVVAAPLWAAPWRATNHSHQARTVRQHPLAPLSLSPTASCSPVVFLSLHPPVKPPLKAYLINALTIFAIFVIKLKWIHFTVCAFDSPREPSRVNWELKTETGEPTTLSYGMCDDIYRNGKRVACRWLRLLVLAYRVVTYPPFGAATHIELKMTVFCFLELEVLVALVCVSSVFVPVKLSTISNAPTQNGRRLLEQLLYDDSKK